VGRAGRGSQKGKRKKTVCYINLRTPIFQRSCRSNTTCPSVGKEWLTRGGPFYVSTKTANLPKEEKAPQRKGNTRKKKWVAVEPGKKGVEDGGGARSSKFLEESGD